LKLAKSLADYWFENGLIGDKAQTIRVFNVDDKNRQVQLIALKKIDANSLKFEEIEEIQKLENDLNKTIFKENIYPREPYRFGEIVNFFESEIQILEDDADV
jgi:hypothetical protein